MLRIYYTRVKLSSVLELACDNSTPRLRIRGMKYTKSEEALGKLALIKGAVEGKYEGRVIFRN